MCADSLWLRRQRPACDTAADACTRAAVCDGWRCRGNADSVRVAQASASPRPSSPSARPGGLTPDSWRLRRMPPPPIPRWDSRRRPCRRPCAPATAHNCLLFAALGPANSWLFLPAAVCCALEELFPPRASGQGHLEGQPSTPEEAVQLIRTRKGLGLAEVGLGHLGGPGTASVGR